MLRLSRSHVQPIGVDIGFDGVKMMQLETVGAGLSVVAAARQPYPDDVRANPERKAQAAVDLIRRMLKQYSFVGKRITACLPREIVHLKNLRLPQMPLAELDAVVGFEARNVFSFDTDE